jgi:hypothetical protein
VKTRRRSKKGHYHRGIHKSPKAGIIKYRSGWELSFCHWLDSNLEVLEYSYECLKIPYTSNRRTGKVRTYIPDFLVTFIDGRKVIYEVKPKKKVSQPTNVKKFMAVREYCERNQMTFSVITEIELKSLGLL